MCLFVNFFKYTIYIFITGAYNVETMRDFFAINTHKNINTQTSFCHGSHKTFP